jgi:uncharacterized protein (TIGR02271 family)
VNAGSRFLEKEVNMQNSKGVEETVIPVVTEELHVDKERVPTGGIRVQKLVREHEEIVDMMLAKDEVDIRRVVIGKDIDGPMPVRREGETIVIPVVEEVVVVEKRFRLKEELHISRSTHKEPHRETVTLKSEEAVVERVDSEGRTVPEQAPAERPFGVLRRDSAPRRRKRILRDD